MHSVGYVSRGFPISQFGAKYIDSRGHAQGRCHHDGEIPKSVEERESRSQQAAFQESGSVRSKNEFRP